MIQLFMITLTSLDKKDELDRLTEVLQKAYFGIQTLTNGFQNNFIQLVRFSSINQELDGLIENQFLGAVDKVLKNKPLVFASLKNIDNAAMANYGLTDDSLKIKLNLLNLKLQRLEKEYNDYSVITEAVDLMDVITDLLAILTLLVNLVAHVNPLIDILQITQSLLKEISRV
jgi:hypothetical protein